MLNNGKEIKYKLKFIDSYRLMPDLPSNLVDNLSQVDKKEPKNKLIGNMRPMTDSLSLSTNKISEIDNKISQIDKKEPNNTFIDNMRPMRNSLSQSINKASEIDSKISQIELNQIIEKFPCTYQLSNKDLNKFALWLRKDVYPYEYVDSWERFNEESLTDKECFYSKLNKEGITDEDYKHAQKV